MRFPFFSQSLWKVFFSTVVFNFFQIVMVSFFLALHEQCFITFKDSNVFEFTNFPFKTKYNNTVVYPADPIQDEGRTGRGAERPPLPVFPLWLLQTWEFSHKTLWLLVWTLLPHWCKISRPLLVPVPHYWTSTKTTPRKQFF